MNVTDFERKKRRLQPLTNIKKSTIRKGKQMGLAASQARLLTITGRKSDCEFESMRLSHQKIALSRELADLSNEYQNSLNQTKLIYDYYGTGDTSTQLSYGILMQPSALNDYMPTTITDALGRVTLNSKYAAAARAAGIPQEGLGTMPSENLRNAFIQGLAGAGIINNSVAERILKLPYNQGIGFGGDPTAAVTTDSGNFDELVEYISNTLTDQMSFSEEIKQGFTSTENNEIFFKLGNEVVPAEEEKGLAFSLKDLLGTKEYTIGFLGSDKDRWTDNEREFLQTSLKNPGGFLDWLEDQFAQVLDLGDGYTKSALEYARSQIDSIIDEEVCTKQNNGHRNTNNNKRDALNKAKNYFGFYDVHRDGRKNNGSNPAGAINLNNIANAFLTYFADFMNGVSKTDSYGIEIFDVNAGSWITTDSSQLASDNKTYQYTWKTGTEVSSDDLGQAQFYDALFNQICTNGWTENDEINDNQYLQQMLQNGMMFITKMQDDGYYYQGNYATDTYIKEIADESQIAYAESKYNTEKAKLNAKEETLDLKMKNLDTEISSLTTEYDTVKNTISKNIETGFKRYG